MKKIRIICAFALMLAIIAGLGVTMVDAATTFPSETDPFGADYLIESTNQSKPFFEVILPEIAANLEENNKHSISPQYDKFKPANNPENFQGLGTTTYANINGKTVTAEAFYRVPTDALCDPNAGMGIMLYQCIQYKIAHPEEEVEITLSYYRTSGSMAVCVLPESKYYGYVRSLYTTNYDEHGFVRISYMLAEAARMGIHVTAISNLNSYAVKQYNPATGKTKNRKPIRFDTYCEKALTTACYNKYAPGKKVSDFMDYVTVSWTVLDQGANMQHVKTCTVSHYLATDGTEHTNGVFYTSANLDDITYQGYNGNKRAQSGIILTGHEEIYQATVNYVKMMYKYPTKEQMQEFRKLVMDMNREQAALIRSGKGDTIPKDERILYLGTENDPVFKLYFTPLDSSVNTWDVENNPVCEYVDKLDQSTGYIEFAWNEFAFESGGYLGVAIAQLLDHAFCSNPNPNNKFAVQVTGLNVPGIENLTVGKQIGAVSIAEGNDRTHTKDFLLSYEEDGVRHNVSILTSANYCSVGFYYRTNSILVIDETEDTDGNFYDLMGKKFSGGIIGG